MSIGIRAQGGIIPPIRVTVSVNGARRSDLECVSISWQIGTAGMSAGFVAPLERWDGVPVRKGDAILVGVDGTTVFRGQVVSITNSASPDGWLVSVRAKSHLALSSGAIVGDVFRQDGPEFHYPRRVRRLARTTRGLPYQTSEATGWTGSGILRDVLPDATAAPRTWRGGGGAVAQIWRDRLGVGDLAGLRASYPETSLKLKGDGLSGAIESLCEACGDAMVRERVAADKNYIDFVSASRGRGVTKVASIGTGNTDASRVTVEAVDCNDDSEGAVSRVIAYGAPARIAVTVYNVHPTASARLQPMWDAARIMSTLSTGETIEQYVLRNPEAAKRGLDKPGAQLTAAQSELSAAIKKVFREYRLPDVIMQYVREKKNVGDVDVQVFTFPLPIEFDETIKKFLVPISLWSAGAVTIDGTGVYYINNGAFNQRLPKLVRAEVDLDTGVIVLAEPALTLLEENYSSAGQPITTFKQALLGITLTVAGRRISFDTGETSALSNVVTVDNDDLRLDAITNNGAPFVDEAGNSITYGEFWMYVAGRKPGGGEGEGVWMYLNQYTIDKDDRYLLPRLANGRLRSGQSRATYDVSIPWFTRAYRVGDALRLSGQSDAPVGPHVITSINWELGPEHRTTLRTQVGAALSREAV